MSDNETENFCFFGTPLEPYDEDAFPKKKPIAIEDQVATDAQGRRRFHGAFTGGFSAGFYNTVGSLEGWLPGEFKSTRGEKAERFTQRPQDFMDDEDMSEFGIAPQVIKTTKDYTITNQNSTSNKRSRDYSWNTPIPGEPVLHTLLTSGNESIGYHLLRNMKRKNLVQKSSETKTYGCEMPQNYEISEIKETYTIHDVYKKYLSTPKQDIFGLGYVGLDKSNLGLFNKDMKKNKRGEAFGVGSFEDEDEDIYAKDSMEKYDFELTREVETKKKKDTEHFVYDQFVLAKKTLLGFETFPAPKLPSNFIAKYKQKASRFEPLPEKIEDKESKPKITPEQRGKLLGEVIQSNQLKDVKKDDKKKEEGKDKEEENRNNTNGNKVGKKFSIADLDFDRFTSGSSSKDEKKEEKNEENNEILDKKCEHGSKEMQDAVRLKLFGPLTRTNFDWKPSSLLCKRFNIPEPMADNERKGNDTRKRTKNLIFEYQKNAEDLMPLAAGLSQQKNTDEVVSVEKEHKIDERGSILEEPSTEKIIIQKDINDRIDIEKNIDLFKSVFLSSDEEEEEDEKTKENNSAQLQEEIKANVLTEPLIPQIKPLKEGLLSNLTFTGFENVIKQNSSKTNIKEEVQVEDEEYYGPKLPEESSQKNVTFKKTLESSDGSDEDEWIEKEEKCDKIKKHKHKKKSKHKKKHKNKKR